MRVFGRDPAVWLALAASALQVVSAFFLPLSDETQSLINAALAAAFGLATAVAVAKEKVLPAIVGLAQALLALAVGFGWDLTGDQQSVLMAFVSIAASMFVRTQVTAPVPPDPGGVRAVS